MGARLVHGIAQPAVAVSQAGRIVAANAAAAEALGAAGSPVGRYCGDVIRALDPDGATGCAPPPCPVLDRLATGEPVALGWCGRAGADGGDGVTPLSGSAIAIPPAERTDHAVALILLHAPPAAQGDRAAAPAGAAIDPVAATRSLRFRFLGGAAVERDGRPVALRRRRVLELAALLAVERAGGLHREELCERLWPDTPGERGRTHLRVLIHEARSGLGPGVFRARRDGTLCLHPDLAVDVRDFRRGADLLLHDLAHGADAAAAATDRPAIDRLLARYGGDFGAGAGWGDWAAPVAQQLRATYCSLLAAAAAHARRAGEVERAITYYERAVEHEPLLEEFQVALITAYGDTGRRLEALARYEAYRGAAAALGLRPSAEFERTVRPVLVAGMRRAVTPAAPAAPAAPVRGCPP